MNIGPIFFNAQKYPMANDDTQLLAPHQGKKWSRGKKVGIVVVIISIAALIGLAIAIGVLSRRKEEVEFYQSIDVNNIMQHLEALNEIANQPSNIGSRGVLEGYDDSIEYVISQLEEKADCEIHRDYFFAPIFYEHHDNPPVLKLETPHVIEFQYGIDYRHLRYGGKGEHNFTAPTSYIPNGGCEESDYENLVEGNICIVDFLSTGDCDLITKATFCEDHGGSAMIIANYEKRKVLSWGRVRKLGYWPGDRLVDIPCLSASHSFGSLIKSLETATLHLETKTSILIVNTSNAYCITKEGNENNTIVAGAHLDSVPEGPGINDNGSGSASLLETIIQWYKMEVKPENRVMFAFWGAEEVGLLGSRYFVNNTRNEDPEAFSKIVLNLNFDMLGSPNYIPFVYTFNGTKNLPPEIENGSNVITRTFEDYFNLTEVPFQLNPMHGGSDFFSFAEAGIPAGGILTGAGGIKSAEQRTKFGGMANAANDPCYHLPCDTIENINVQGLGIMSRAAAYAIYELATTTNLRDVLKEGK